MHVLYDIILVVIQKIANINKKHLKNVGPIRHCEPPVLHCHSPGVTTVTHRHCRTPSKLVVPLRRCCNFTYFQDGHCRHLGFLKSWNFIGYLRGDGWDASACQILSKSVVPLCRYCDFSSFQDGCRRHLAFWNREILLAIGVQRVQMHQNAKFCQNRSIGCKDIKIFPFFKMAAAAILDFWNREILLVIRVRRLETHQYAKCRQNQSIGCEDIKIFQDGGRPPYWICLGHIWTTKSEYLGVSIPLQNLVMIDAVVFISHLHIDVHDNDNDDNAWQRGPLWPHGMCPMREAATALSTCLKNTKNNAWTTAPQMQSMTEEQNLLNCQAMNNTLVNCRKWNT